MVSMGMSQDGRVSGDTWALMVVADRAAIANTVSVATVYFRIAVIFLL